MVWAALLAASLAALLVPTLVTPALADTAVGVAGKILDARFDVTNDRIYVLTGPTVEVYTMGWSHVGSVDLGGWLSGPIALGGGAVWVADGAGGTIAEIDPSGLTVTGHVGSGIDNLEQLSYAGGFLWFDLPSSGLTRLDPGTGTLKNFPYDGTKYPAYPLLVTDPSDPNVLVAWDQNSNAPRVYRYDASTKPPTLLGTYVPPEDLGLPAGAVSPDGSRIFLVHMVPTVGVVEVDTSTMTAVNEYAFPSGVQDDRMTIAVATDGAHVAAGPQDPGSPLSVWAVGSSTPVRTYDPGLPCQAFVPRIAFADASTLLIPQDGTPSTLLQIDNVTSAGHDAGLSVNIPGAIAPTDPVTVSGTLTLPSGDTASGRAVHVWRYDEPDAGGRLLTDLGTTTTTTGGAYSLDDTAIDVSTTNSCYQVLYEGDAHDAATENSVTFDVQRVPTSLTVGVSPTQLAPTQTVTVEGTFGTADGKDVGGQVVSISRWSTGTGKVTTVGQATTASDGSYVFTEPAPARGSYSYSAHFAGSVRDAPTDSSASDTVYVATLDPGLSVKPHAKTVTYGDADALTITLTPDAPMRKVQLSQRIAGTSTFTPVGRYSVPGSGTLSVPLTPKANVTYAVRYAGDAVFAGATARTSVSVRAIVRCRMLKDRGTSGIYHLYRTTDAVYMYGKVVPDHTGQRVEWWIERPRPNGWSKPYTKGFTLRSNSQLIVYLSGGIFNVGARFRIRYSFEDKDHAEGLSTWQYVKFER